MTCEKCKNEHDGTYGSGRFCSQSCANRQVHSEETKRKISMKCSGISPPNKGTSKYQKIQKICPICSKPFTVVEWNNKTYCSKACNVIDQKNGNKFCKIGGPGAENKGGRNSFKGYYKGIWCDSTYELVWVIYNLDHNITFERNQTPFPYITPDGKTHSYYPDFKQGDEYIETKNYLKDNDQYKIQQFPYKLTILFGKDLVVQFEYVYSKYGKDLKSLYDKKMVVPGGLEPPNFRHVKATLYH